ncbi:MAG: Carbon-nitrogen hydrolase [Phylliscum demangeonii]|nr:MAG: Carbon-nitrogen hydrolase [Phylliscum demangeonii]
MRIASLQFNPQLGDGPQNVQRANALLERLGAGDVDVLMLPELAFSGYNHASRAAIAPSLEPTTAGLSTRWAIDTARRLACYVSVGYPEIACGDGGERCYNAVVVVSPEGKVLVNYRKTFLYYTDESWATEGAGFFAGEVERLGQTAMGICMDINPYRFTAPWTDYEFARHALASASSLLLLTMAWLTSECEAVAGPGAGARTKPSRPPPTQPDGSTLSYWLERLGPLIMGATGEREVVVAICNRCGQEGSAIYAGTTTVLGLKGGQVRCYGILGHAEEGVLVVDTSATAKAPVIGRWAG